MTQKRLKMLAAVLYLFVGIIIGAGRGWVRISGIVVVVALMFFLLRIADYIEREG